MGIFDFQNEKTIDQGDTRFDAPLTSFSDVVSASFQNTRDNFNTDAKTRLTTEAWENNYKAFQEATGQDINEYFKTELEEAQRPYQGLSPKERDRSESEIRYEVFSKGIDKLRSQDPEKYKSLKNGLEVLEEAKGVAKDSEKKFNEVLEGATGFDSFTGSLAGGIGAGMVDPISIATMPFGAGASKSIMKAMLIEAGVNAAAETAMQPMVADWQKELGNEYGFTDMAEQVGMAFLTGGAMTGTMKGVPLALRKGKPLAQSVFAKIADHPKLNSTAKAAAKFMERVAHIKENIPFNRVDEITEDTHFKALDKTQRAIENREKLDLKEELAEVKEDLDIFDQVILENKKLEAEAKTKHETTKEFFNEEKIEGPTPQKAQAEVRKLKGKKSAKTEKRKTQKGKESSAEGFTRGEVLEVNPKTKEIKIKDSEGNIETIKSDLKFKKGEQVEIKKTNDSQPEVNRVKEYSESQGYPEKPSYEYQKKAIEESQSHQAMKAQDADFKRLLDENNLDQQIVMGDGEVMSMRQISEMIDNDEKYLGAIQTCAIG